MHQHPSQALLDLRTLLTRLRLDPTTARETSLAGVTVVITGDVRHSRVARSNAMLLPRLGARVILCGPEPLLPEHALTLHPAVEIVRDFDAALAQAALAPVAAAAMMLRIQQERLHNLDLDLPTYIAAFQLTAERLASLIARAPQTIVMHPGPMIRGLEIQGEVADSTCSAIEEQVTHGLAIRAALLLRALGGIGRKEEPLPSLRAES
jgi:aspartate carbamoyltransferase catalytic subunit